METYGIMRRGGRRALDELYAASARSTAEGGQDTRDIRLIRSYLLAETNGSWGTLCTCQASTPESRRHTAAAAHMVTTDAADAAREKGHSKPGREHQNA